LREEGTHQEANRHLDGELWSAFQAFHGRMSAQLAKRGHDGLTGAQASAIAQLDPLGTRASVVAERMGISKQAVSQFIDELERMGYVERVADPLDARAKLVRCTRKGARYRRDVDAARDAIEKEVLPRIGQRGLSELRTQLQRVTEALGDREATIKLIARQR
jgi:DNA-binding MarR family transcriptional regulator